MSALTLRLSYQKHQRLKALAKSKGVSLNYLLDEVTLILAEFDLKTQFEVCAQSGHGKTGRGHELLAKAKAFSAK